MDCCCSVRKGIQQSNSTHLARAHAMCGYRLTTQKTGDPTQVGLKPEEDDGSLIIDLPYCGGFNAQTRYTGCRFESRTDDDRITIGEHGDDIPSH